MPTSKSKTNVVTIASWSLTRHRPGKPAVAWRGRSQFQELREFSKFRPTLCHRIPISCSTCSPLKTYVDIKFCIMRYRFPLRRATQSLTYFFRCRKWLCRLTRVTLCTICHSDRNLMAWSSLWMASLTSWTKSWLTSNTPLMLFQQTSVRSVNQSQTAHSPSSECLSFGYRILLVVILVLVVCCRYSVTEMRQDSNFMAGIYVHQGIFFKYDFSPLRIELRETRQPFTAFFTSICAMLGGILTCSSCINTCTYHTAEEIKKLAWVNMK